MRGATQAKWVACAVSVALAATACGGGDGASGSSGRYSDSVARISVPQVSSSKPSRSVVLRAVIMRTTPSGVAATSSGPS